MRQWSRSQSNLISVNFSENRNWRSTWTRQDRWFPGRFALLSVVFGRRDVSHAPAGRFSSDLFHLVAALSSDERVSDASVSVSRQRGGARTRRVLSEHLHLLQVSRKQTRLPSTRFPPPLTWHGRQRRCRCHVLHVNLSWKCGRVTCPPGASELQIPTAGSALISPQIESFQFLFPGRSSCRAAL